MKELLKDRPYWIYDLLSLISAIITIITAVIAVIKAVVRVKQLEDGTYTVSFNKMLAFLCFVFALFILVCILKICKYGRLLRNIKCSISDKYYEFLHDFRNYYCEVDKVNSLKKEDNAHLMELLTENTRRFIQSALDSLCIIMNSITGEKICACIKLLENNENTKYDINKNNAKVFTFCRSANSDTNRKANDKMHEGILISDNTDFYDILDEQSLNTNSYFYQTDLLQYDKDLRKLDKQYKNSTPNYEKYYRGTIVVPIRISRKILDNEENKDGYNVIGFLCVDSLSTNAFRNTNFDKSCNSKIVKSFAAEIYIILQKYNRYLECLNGGKKYE